MSISEFQLSDTELDRITTNGILTIGDRAGATGVDDIYVNGVSYSSGFRGTFLVASHINVT